MGEIKSSLGTTHFASKPMRDLEVPDESGYTSKTAGIAQRHQRPAQPLFDTETMREFAGRAAVPEGMREISPAELEEQIKGAKLAKQAQLAGKERLTDGAKSRIEHLIGMTRLKREIVIGTDTYILQTLRSREWRDALVAAAEYDGTVQFSFELRKQILARSLIQVANVDIESFLRSSELEDKLFFIEEMDHNLLTRLQSEYTLLSNEAQEKYAVKSEDDIKEVVSDLKKA